MAAASLMTLPSEIRLLIWPHTILDTVELKVPGCYETGDSAAWNYIPLPPNPQVPLMLINKQAKEEMCTLPPVTLIVTVHDHVSLDQWCQSSTLRDKKFVSRVRVDRQIIKDLARESLPRREESAAWWIKSTLGDELVRGFGHVKVLESGLSVSLLGQLDGWLDVTFEVGDAREERLTGTAGCHSYKVKRREGRRWEWFGHGSKGRAVE